MSDQPDPIAIIGCSCRLPGNVRNATNFWTLLSSGQWEECSTEPPISRGFDRMHPESVGYIKHGGWLGPEGVEDFDAKFFGIPPGEAEVLRPNSRIALELTWEALENAGIQPSALRGKNVSVSIAMGAEDGWDLRRFAEDGREAFDHNWAQNSDPSAVAGRVSHFFDFHGAIGTVSGACASGVNALEYGTNSFVAQGAELAVVGALATHFTPAPFLWASSVGVASCRGRCSAFSDQADGYLPSEGAVFFILKKAAQARCNGDCIYALIPSITLRHNGFTQTLTSPSADRQASQLRESLSAANISAGDVVLHEAHGTGTILGDMIELEAIKNVYNVSREDPLYLTSSKTIVGHCQAAAALVGVLKVILCIVHRTIPPHHIEPYPDLKDGIIRVPIRPICVGNDRPFIATVSALGFTGGAGSIVLQEPPRPSVASLPSYRHYLLPFSGKTKAALRTSMDSVGHWIKTCDCSIQELSVILSLTREHHRERKAFVVQSLREALACLGLTAPGGSLICTRADDSGGYGSECSDAPDIRELASSSSHPLATLAYMYETGRDLDFSLAYCRSMIPAHLLRSFPTYPFERERYWRYPPSRPKPEVAGFSLPSPVSVSCPDSDATGRDSDSNTSHLSVQSVSAIVSKLLHQEMVEIDPRASVFDLGINSLSSIELAQSLSRGFSRTISVGDLYRLSTISSIYDFLVGRSGYSSVCTQGHLDALIEKFSAPFRHFPQDAHRRPNRESETTIVLTGATGFLGSRILSRLLRMQSVKVVCPVRGSHPARLDQVFGARGLDRDVLQHALQHGTLRVVTTSGLGDPLLGCSDEVHQNILGSVDVIIHCAWKVDFNHHLPGFEADLAGVRSLAEVAVRSRKTPKLYFITSFSASFGYEGVSVPEVPLDCKIGHALSQGYAVSKLAAEYILYGLRDRYPGRFALGIVRVGQICGDSRSGGWNTNEMIPMVLRSIFALGMVPRALPDVSWVPVDVCADAICDFVSDALCERRQALMVYNVANPEIVAWPTVVRYAASALDCPMPRMVDLGEYIKALEAFEKSLNADELLVRRLLPSLKEAATTSGFPSRYCPLDVRESLKFSPSLSNCPVIDEEFVRLLMHNMSGVSVEVCQGSPQALVGSDTVSGVQYAFVFGPWAGTVTSWPSDLAYNRILERLFARAEQERSEPCITDDRTHGTTQNALQFQLRALAYQLFNVERLSRTGIRPSLVTGYCFGEFAAAIIGGRASEADVVKVLVQRDLAIRTSRHKKTVRDISLDADGGREDTAAMLNVFLSAAIVQRHLILIGAELDIAIHAGPMHTIISGCPAAISRAEAYFLARQLPCKLIATDIPFHSKQMNGAVDLLRQLLGEARPVSSSDKCIYLSGLTGNVLSKGSLAMAYWMRHMREPVRFSECMQVLHRMRHSESGSASTAGWTFVDMGPGMALTSIVGRYQWEDFQLVSVDQCLHHSHPLDKLSPLIRHTRDDPPPKTAEPAISLSRSNSLQDPMLCESNTPASRTLQTGLRMVKSLGTHLHTDVHELKIPSPPLTAAPLPVENNDTLKSAFLSTMSDLFRYAPESDRTLLRGTFIGLGIDSLSFVRLSQALRDKTGRTLPASAYTSGACIEDILRNL
ncbi:hypothetical protein GLOTRDRAFT_96463 [Gloeophyllum trabeum ATCC 11539]|uniref:Uncharacterized protein n=1 Tax=Gloeophyllum trabeum (strain ATCC 11539 / FP-39264 / Madison 617) TaxID=670483 RepID=S7PUC3_GLOTA|nr:uncharacterized protein GLOTRDRAFT_96463 [Gloeophyllum trabeum ATCC 11539]EPQ51411.1 hypothetical protein GLOTRDRAFT_96463 [Gloeophyllum trabeum ATCC 11539]